MKHSTKTLLCVLCAAAAALCVIFAIFTLTKKQSASSASSAAASSSAASSAPAVSEYSTVDSFDYQNSTYSDGLDANGYRTGITAQDYVTLPDNVAALPIKKADVTPSDSDVQARIDSLLSQYSTTQAVTDRAAQNGDVVNIDCSGTVDGVAFNGGTYQGYDLTLGSGSFITGFEDQIVGHNTGDTFDVTVTFPDGYDASTDSDGNTVELHLGAGDAGADRRVGGQHLRHRRRRAHRGGAEGLFLQCPLRPEPGGRHYGRPAGHCRFQGCAQADL